MSNPKKIIKLTPSGYFPDQPKQDGTQFEVARNMTTSAGVPVSVGGWQNVYANVRTLANNTDPVIFLTNVEVEGVNYWMYHTPNSSWVVTGTDHTDITVANGFSQVVDNPSNWTGGVLNGIAFVNNFIEPPMYWDGSTSSDMEYLPDFPAGTRCRRMVAHKNYLFALGIEGPSGVFPEMIAWSDSAAPGEIPQSWTPAADSDAGAVILAETAGELVTALSLRDILLIYKKKAIYSARFIGGNEIFQFDTLFTNRGALGTHSVCSTGISHFVVGDGDVYITDGSQFQSIADGKIKSLLFGQLNANNVDQLFTVYKPFTNSVEVCFPSLGSERVDTCLEYNLNDGTWGSKELFPMNPLCAAIGYVSDESSNTEVWDDADFEWDTRNIFWNARTFSTAASSIVYGAEQLYKGDFGYTKNGDPLTFTGIITNIDFEDPSVIKHVKALYPSIYGEPGQIVNFRVGACMAVDGPIQWSSTLPYELGSDDAVHCRVMGKLIALEITATNPILLNSISLEADRRGYR